MTSAAELSLPSSVLASTSNVSAPWPGSIRWEPIGGRPTENAYWACFFDQGRGCFRTKARGGNFVDVVSENLELLRDLRRTFGGSSLDLSTSTGGWGSQPLFCWRICGYAARAMARRVIPYMRRRREVVEAWLAAYNPPEEPLP